MARRSDGGSALLVLWREVEENRGRVGELEGENRLGHGGHDSHKSCHSLLADELPPHASARPC